jgi:hypothetical protein
MDHAASTHAAALQLHVLRQWHADALAMQLPGYEVVAALCMWQQRLVGQQGLPAQSVLRQMD